jgi:hypothetical protein
MESRGHPYPNTGTTRWIVRNDVDRGSTVVLDDGSSWKILESNQEIARSWPKTKHVTVTRAFEGGYILSTEDEQAVYAVYRGFATL